MRYNMITKRKEIGKLDINFKFKTISLRYDTVIEEDGEEIFRNHHRKAFVPGEIEDLKTYTGLSDTNKHIKYIDSLWTPSVVQDYQDYLATLG